MDFSSLQDVLNRGFKADSVIDALKKNKKYGTYIKNALAYGFAPFEILKSLARQHKVDLKEDTFNTAEARGARAEKAYASKARREAGTVLGTAAGLGALAAGGLGRAAATGVEVLPPEEKEGEIIDVTPKPTPPAPSQIPYEEKKRLTQQEPPAVKQPMPVQKEPEIAQPEIVKPQKEEEEKDLDINLAAGMNKIGEYVRKMAKAGKTAPFIHVMLMRSKKLGNVARKYQIATGKNIYDYIANLTQATRGETKGAKGGDVLMGLMEKNTQPQGQINDIFSAMDDFEKYL